MPEAARAKMAADALQAGRMMLLLGSPEVDAARASTTGRAGGPLAATGRQAGVDASADMIDVASPMWKDGPGVAAAKPRAVFGNV